MSDKIRLDKFLSNQGKGSRKDVSILIRSGKVLVNSCTVKAADFKINPQIDLVTLNGEEIEYTKYIYLMMNKPAGILSATRDKSAETVLDLVPKAFTHRDLFPAGRLDKDTTGLLIITDDGDMAHKMLAPKSHVYKLYKAKLDGEITKEDIAAFEAGIKSGENEFMPAQLVLPEEDKHIALVKIREGKFHQVKRMFLARGKTVLKLERLKIGSLSLDPELKLGECKELSFQEIASIFR